MIHMPSRRQGTQVLFLGWEDPLEEEMATHSSILAWELPRIEEPGGLSFAWGLKELTGLSRDRERTDASEKAPPR
jgi:hypothetical protein